MRRSRLLSMAIAAVTPLLFSTASMADYPEKPINMIIGFKAGGGTDVAGRVLARELQQVIGQPVVVVQPAWRRIDDCCGSCRKVSS